MAQARKSSPMTPRQAAACRRPVDALLDPQLFRALGDPTRIRILGCLVKCGRPCSVGELAECCAVDLSVVCRHLQSLARAGLLSASRSGRTVSYSVTYAETCRRLRRLADSIAACAPDAKGAACAGGRCERC
ncbi:MAG: winged helix-turn-helix transcriptional regulator [Phycisphaerales bacterium]|nr:winged helix-turn-helix transcriptional regulator [Phycisphaerales bacterium]